jgi:hypothetical protein
MIRATRARKARVLQLTAFVKGTLNCSCGRPRKASHNEPTELNIAMILAGERLVKSGNRRIFSLVTRSVERSNKSLMVIVTVGIPPLKIVKDTPPTVAERGNFTTPLAPMRRNKKKKID